MTWREALVDEFIALLAPLKQVANVDRCPDDLAKARFVHPKANVWVGYHSSRDELPGVTAGNVQDSEIRFDVGVLTRSLHGPHGATNFIDMVEERVVGKRLSRGGFLYWVTDSFGAHKNGVWRHDIVIGLRLVKVPPAAELASDQTIGPALRYALLEDEQSGDTSVGTDPDAET